MILKKQAQKIRNHFKKSFFGRKVTEKKEELYYDFAVVDQKKLQNKKFSEFFPRTEQITLFRTYHSLR